jgi:hypothetical protein
LIDRFADFVVAPRVAEMLTVSLGLARFVLTEKVAEVLPFAIVTDTGTLALLSLLESERVIPPDGAAEPRVTAAVEAPPAATVFGLMVKETRLGGSTDSVAFTVTPFDIAVSVAAVSAATGVVLTAKVAESLPATTVTVARTVATPALLERLTLSPPAGAGPDRVIKPEADVPPATDAGSTPTLTSAGGSTVNVADWVIDASFAVTVPTF